MTSDQTIIGIYQRAEKLAEVVMGKKVAESDPLARWCLVEAIVSFGNAGPHRMSK